MAKDTPRCPKCGSELLDAGSYKWDCPSGCFPISLELWQMEDENDDEEKEVFETEQTEGFINDYSI